MYLDKIADKYKQLINEFLWTANFQFLGYIVSNILVL